MSAERTRLGVTFTKAKIDGIDRLIREGIFLDRGTAVREAVRLLLRDHGIPPFYREAESLNQSPNQTGRDEK